MTEENVIQLEHLIAGAIHANGGQLKFNVSHLFADDNFGKQISLVVEDDIAIITLVESEPETEEAK
jgi:hypothetical protein